MTIKTTVYLPSICKNCGNKLTEAGLYFRMHNVSFVLCKECSIMLSDRIRSMHI